MKNVSLKIALPPIISFYRFEAKTTLFHSCPQITITNRYGLLHELTIGEPRVNMPVAVDMANPGWLWPLQ